MDFYNRPTAMIISTSDISGGFFLSARNRMLLNTIERECYGRDIARRLCIYFDWDKKRRLYDAWSNEDIDLDKIDNVAGFIVMVDAIKDPFPLIETLWATGKPLVVLDDGENVQFPHEYTGKSHIAHFKVGITGSAGGAMADFLVEQGHKNIAYFSHCHWKNWSKLRFQSMTDTFESKGFQGSAHLFGIDTFRDYYECYKWMPKDYKTFDPIRRLKRKIAGVQKSVSEATVHYIEDLKYTVSEMFNIEGLWYAMTPLFEKALADTSITAWVCSYDGLAELALQFLEEKGVPVPDQVSVAGFDDLPGSLGRNLTTFNFNIEGITYRILSFLFQAFPERDVGSILTYEIHGMVVERGSVRSVKNKGAAL